MNYLMERLQSSVSILEMSVRARNCLIQNGIATIGDMVKLDATTLLSFKNVGEKTKNEILALIEKEHVDDCVLESIRLRQVQECNEWKGSLLASSVGLQHDFSEMQIIDQNDNVVPDLPLTEVELSYRLYKALNAAGIDFFSKLIKVSDFAFHRIDNLGEKSYNEVLNVIQSHIKFDRNVSTHVENESINYLTRDFSEGCFSNQLNEIKNKAYCFLIRRKSDANLTDDDFFEFVADDYFLDLLLQKVKSKLQLELLCDYESFESIFRCRLKKIEKNVIDYALQKGVIENFYGKYVVKSPSFREYIFSLNDSVIGNVIRDCVQGKNYRYCAEKLGVSRERVRQKILAFIQKSPFVKEDIYIFLLAKYCNDANLLKDALSLDEFGYFYFKIKLNGENNQLINSLTDELIPIEVRGKIEKYLFRNYINIDGTRIPRNRDSIFNYVLMHECCEYVDAKEFKQKYNAFLERYVGVYDERLECYDSIGVKLSKYENCLCVQGERFRYFNISAVDFSKLLESINFKSLKNIEISTRFFLLRYQDTLNDYDIHDEYELHNLLRKKFEGQQGFTFLRMPCMKIGSASRKEQMLQLLQLESTIGYEEFAKKYENLYGVKQTVFFASYAPIVRKYLHNGVYSVNHISLSDEELNFLKNILKEKLYDLFSVKALFVEKFNESRLAAFNSFSLKKINWHIASNLLYLSEKEGFDVFFSENMMNGDVVDFSDKTWLLSNHCVYNYLYRVKQNYEWLEFEPNKFISFSKLREIVESEDCFDNFAKAAAHYAAGKIFTIKSLRLAGFHHKLDLLGFENFFYESILKSAQNLSHAPLGNVYLFSDRSTEVHPAHLIKNIVEKEGLLNIYDCLEQLRTNFGVDINKQKLIELAQSANLFYSKSMEKLYIDYDTFIGDL